MSTKQNQRGFSALEILIIILAVVILGASGYLIYHEQNNKKQSKTTTSTAGSTLYAHWKTYRLASEGATIKYPSGWKLSSTFSPDAVSGITNVTITDPTAETVTDSTGSTVSGNMQVLLSYGDIQEPNESTGGVSYVVSSMPLKVPGYKTLRLIKNGFGSTKNIYTISLSDTNTPVGSYGAQTGAYTSKKDSSYVVEISAGLFNQPPSGSGGFTTLAPNTFASLSSYSTAYNILKSLTY